MSFTRWGREVNLQFRISNWMKCLEPCAPKKRTSSSPSHWKKPRQRLHWPTMEQVSNHARQSNLPWITGIVSRQTARKCFPPTQWTVASPPARTLLMPVAIHKQQTWWPYHRLNLNVSLKVCKPSQFKVWISHRWYNHQDRPPKLTIFIVILVVKSTLSWPGIKKILLVARCASLELQLKMHIQVKIALLQN